MILQRGEITKWNENFAFHFLRAGSVSDCTNKRKAVGCDLFAVLAQILTLGVLGAKKL